MRRLARWVFSPTLVLLTGGLIASNLALAQAPQHPHIVFILADDLSFKSVGYNGGEISTPTIDNLASSGAKLTNYYSLHLSTPARAALMTGRYPMRYGLQTAVLFPDEKGGLPLDERTLAQALKETGYKTYLVGKWQLGHSDKAFWPTRRGFDYAYGCLQGEIDYYKKTQNGILDWWRNEKVVSEPGYVTALLGKDAGRIISQHDVKQPMFLYLALTAPHTPYQVPQTYLDRYQQIQDPAKRAYAAMVTALDDAVADVVTALAMKGIKDDTLIVFASDNGGVLPAADNSPYRGSKGSLYEGALRTAAFAVWPGKIKSGTLIGERTHVTDWYPTLVKVAGGKLEQPKAIDGFDLWPALGENKPIGRKELLVNAEQFRGAVIKDDWKLIEIAGMPSRIMLFNLKDDPSEKSDQASANPEKVKELNSLLGKYLKEQVMAQWLKSRLTPTGKELLPFGDEGDVPDGGYGAAPVIPGAGPPPPPPARKPKPAPKKPTA